MKQIIEWIFRLGEKPGDHFSVNKITYLNLATYNGITSASISEESMRGMVGDSYRVGVFSEKWTVFLFSLVYNVEGEVMSEFNACFNTVCLAKIQTVTHNTQYKKPLHPRTLFVHPCGDTFCHSLCPPVVTGHPIEFVHKIPCGAPQPLEFPQGDFLFSVSVFSISIKKNVNMKSHVTLGKRFSRCLDSGCWTYHSTL